MSTRRVHVGLGSSSDDAGLGTRAGRESGSQEKRRERERRGCVCAGSGARVGGEAGSTSTREGCGLVYAGSVSLCSRCESVRAVEAGRLRVRALLACVAHR